MLVDYCGVVNIITACYVLQEYVLSPFLFVVVVDVVTELAIVGVLSELLYADDLVLMSETMEGLSNMLLKWKEAFESTGLKDNFGKSKLMVSSGIMQDGLSKSKVDPCVVFSLRVKAITVLCGELTHVWFSAWE